MFNLVGLKIIQSFFFFFFLNGSYTNTKYTKFYVSTDPVSRPPLPSAEMIEKLTLTFNRTRQAVITKELIEIISGAAAL